MTSTTTAKPRVVIQPLSSVRRSIDLVYAVLSGVFVFALLVQVYLAGVGSFAGPQVQHAFSAHEQFGDILGIASIVLMILAILAHVGKWTVTGAVVLAVLTEVAQHGLAQAGHDNRWVGGLHAFDGMLILLVSVGLAIAAYRRCRTR